MSPVHTSAGDITIILPVHNGMPYVREAIASVLAQTRRDWRLLVVDDASTDGSAEVIRACADPRIELVQHLTSVGLYATLAVAVPRVETEFVSILLQDDRLHPEYLAALSSVVARFPMADAFWIAEDTIDRDGQVLTSGQTSGRVQPIRPGVRFWRRALTKGCLWTISGSLTRRSLLAESPFRLDRAHCADYDWFLRASRARPFVYYQRSLIDLRWCDGTASARRRPHARHMSELCAVIEEQLDRYPLDLPIWRVCGIAASRTWQCGVLLARHLAHGPADGLWPLLRTALRFLRLPPRAAIRRWLAWQPDLAHDEGPGHAHRL
jgi:glycosyltransferase involved in cell wall biosynthesis